MKTKIFLTTTMLFLIIGVFSQTIELAFTAVENISYVQLDSIKVMNLSREGDTVLYYPDTILVLDYQSGIPETSINFKGFRVCPNYPNPVSDRTTVSIYVPDKDIVNIFVTDMPGHILLKTNRILEKGMHSFGFIPGKGNFYFFTAQWRGITRSIKIMKTATHSSRKVSLTYLGKRDALSKLKATGDIQNFRFKAGDTLLYIGYMDTLQSGRYDAPVASGIYPFQFAYNIPCPGTPTVEYEGQIYHTVQIFNQCWMKENLNVGTMIETPAEMTDNDVIEKYCNNNNPQNCETYGGLYQWDEMMQYGNSEGNRGICPPGWHIPADQEWKILEGAVDSYYGIGNNIWNEINPRGYDVGANLKTTSGWYLNGNGNDKFGFSVLPGASYRNENFWDPGATAYLWTATEYAPLHAWFHFITYDLNNASRMSNPKAYGFSVRCVKD